MKYAVIDLEATGAKKNLNRIIEIGVVLTDGLNVEKTFQTFVNPESAVTPFVEKLTGITSLKLKSAPLFSAIAKKINEMLQGRIFVAHNVSFDFSLLREELFRCGISLSLPRLCTLKLSRKAFPRLPHYNLKYVCEYLALPEFAAHRALDDAMGAFGILRKAIETHGEEFVWKQATHKGTLALNK